MLSFNSRILRMVNKAKDEGFYLNNRIFITYEELENGTTEVNIGETSVGISVGATGVATG
jgi:hypothetical protein